MASKRPRGSRGMRFLGWCTLACCVVLSGSSLVRAQDLSVSPMSWDFGNVLVGTSEMVTFDLLSVGTSDVSIYLLFLNDNPDYHPPYVNPDDPDDPLWALGPFSFNPATWPDLPAILPPGEHLFVDMIFSPTAPGDYSAYLYVRSNDTYPPPGQIGLVPLEGTGVLVPVPPAILLGALGVATAGWLCRRHTR